MNTKQRKTLLNTSELCQANYLRISSPLYRMYTLFTNIKPCWEAIEVSISLYAAFISYSCLTDSLSLFSSWLIKERGEVSYQKGDMSISDVAFCRTTHPGQNFRHLTCELLLNMSIFMRKSSYLKYTSQHAYIDTQVALPAPP